MRFWSLYFFLKLWLYAGGHLGFHAALNAAFAAFTALPADNRRLRLAKNVVAIPLAVALWYHDSWLPPLPRLLSQAPELASFSPAYLLALAARFIDWSVVLQLLLVVALYLLLRRKLRLGTFAFLAVVAAALLPAPGARPGAAPAPPGAGPAETQPLRPESPDTRLALFYENESHRQVVFPHAADGPAFDILLLHVCSLSWEDLRVAGVSDSDWLARYQLILTQFNSAASYSGPAAIRLLRGSCGQGTHAQLYDPPADGCLLIDGLQQAGFEPHWLMNHDGHYGNFFADVSARGGMPVAPEPIAGAVVGLHAFDGTPVYDDYSVLSRWWARRAASPAARVVLYYNTITLHDGNRGGGRAADFSRAAYAERAQRLLGEIGRFLGELRASGRRAVVVLIPEHGAALRGDQRQIPGLRELPTPAITRVPVAIAFAGPGMPRTETPIRIDTPLSYLAVSELLSRITADNPFAGRQAQLSAYLGDLPQTPFVAANEDTVIMRAGADYLLRTPDGSWSPWYSEQ